MFESELIRRKLHNTIQARGARPAGRAAPARAWLGLVVLMLLKPSGCSLGHTKPP